jgi:hypothetical protein
VPRIYLATSQLKRSKLIAAQLAGQACRLLSSHSCRAASDDCSDVGVGEYRDHSITGLPAWLMWRLLHFRTVSRSHSKLSIVRLRLSVRYCRRPRLVRLSSSELRLYFGSGQDLRRERRVSICLVFGRSAHSLTTSATLSSAGVVHNRGWQQQGNDIRRPGMQIHSHH